MARVTARPVTVRLPAQPSPALWCMAAVHGCPSSGCQHIRPEESGASGRFTRGALATACPTTLACAAVSVYQLCASPFFACRLEILRQCDMTDIDYIFVPIGGGGMVAGIAAVVKALKPKIQVIGVEPTGANAMAQVGVGVGMEWDGMDWVGWGGVARRQGVASGRWCGAHGYQRPHRWAAVGAARWPGGGIPAWHGVGLHGGSHCCFVPPLGTKQRLQSALHASIRLFGPLTRIPTAVLPAVAGARRACDPQQGGRLRRSGCRRWCLSCTSCLPCTGRLHICLSVLSRQPAMRFTAVGAPVP